MPVPWEEVQDRYITWYEKVWAASEEFQEWESDMQNLEENFSAEDMGDLVDAIKTLVSFGPSPKAIKQSRQPMVDPDWTPEKGQTHANGLLGGE